VKKKDIYFARKLLVNLVKLNFVKLKLGNSVSHSKENSVIPRVVFQTTKSKWIPVKFWLDIKRFRKHNPEFTFLTFSQRDMKQWMKKNYNNSTILSAFEDSTLGVMQSDIFRYCYAYKQGGVSLDSTKYLSAKLNLVFSNAEARLILSQESHSTSINGLVSKLKKLNLSQSLIISWCFATSPHHPAIKSVIDQIESNYASNKRVEFEDVKDGIWKMTGTVAFNYGILSFYEEKLDRETVMLGIDFNEPMWPKFQSASLVNMFRRHYVDLSDLVLFN
jgi:mannosyltransferase OCH1-like enzyme